jgi:hypothetical protein
VASASRSGTTSTATIRAQPTARAASTADSPTAPAPNTAMLDPAGGRSEFITAPAPVWTPQPSGPISSSGTSAGIGTTDRACTFACRANEDWPKKWEESCPPSRSRSAVDPSGRVPPKLRAYRSAQ